YLQMHGSTAFMHRCMVIQPSCTCLPVQQKELCTSAANNAAIAHAMPGCKYQCFWAGAWLVNGLNATCIRRMASSNVDIEAAYEILRHSDAPNASPGTRATCASCSKYLHKYTHSHLG